MRISITTLSLLFLFAPAIHAQKQTPLDIALRHVEQNREKWSLTAADVSGMTVISQYATRHNGVTHVYLQQQHAGLSVHNAILGVHITSGGRVAYATSRFVARLAEQVNATRPSLPAQEALRRAAAHLELPLPETPVIIGTEGKTGVIFDGADLARQPIRAWQVYQPLPGRGVVRLAWNLEIDHRHSPNYWTVRVDAVTGEVLDVANYTVFCQPAAGARRRHAGACFGEEAPPATATPLSVEAALRQAHAPAPPATATYNVFPLPLENPNWGERQLVVNPADPVASPFGWHDTNGQPGAEYTITRGNNVHAFLDTLDIDVSSNDEPNGGDLLLFDFPFDPNWEPRQYQKAAVTQLFYTNNVLHDFAYHYGFDEEAGNFQQNNYGRGGRQGDPVEGNAQDGGSFNNANFSAPPDGQRGRMQMYLWRSDRSRLLTVTAPAALAGMYETSTAAFGPAVSNTPISGRIVQARDNTPNPLQACGTLVNAAALRGNIAMIDRGNCLFEEKTVTAERAGAIAVIICNNEDAFVSMGGSTTIPDPRIPTVMIKASDCRRIRDFLQQGVEATIRLGDDAGPQLLDGDFDNGIVAHEYGHGISIRLTGSPATSTCLTNDEQMGEGWSDFFTLVTTYRPGARGIEPRGIGNYVSRETASGGGIRRLPYSTDMAVNNQLYDDIIGVSGPHPLGEIWAATLWDLYWKFVDVYGWDDDLFNGQGGNNMAIQLVFDGLKLQACNPGYVDGRDAIIAADLINNDGANECLIWEVFARRGLGWEADQGSNRSRNDGRQDFRPRPECIRELKIAKSATPLINPGEPITYTLTITNHKAETVSQLTVRDELPAGASYLGGSALAPAPPRQEGNALFFDVGQLASGESLSFSYQVTTDPARRSVRQFYDDVEDGDENWFFNNLAGSDIWGVTREGALSGSQAWFVPNTLAANDQVLQLFNPARVSGSQPVLRFYHRYDTQPGTDGGIVETSTDGGATWTPVPAGQIFRHTYRGRMAFNTFSLNRVDGFWGDSREYVASYIDLSPFLGQELSFRFRFGSQANISRDSTAGDGWFVDDIELMDMYNFSSEACVTSAEGDVACALPEGRGTVVEPQELTSTDGPASRPLQVRVFPNPAGEWVNVAVRSARPTDATVELLSLDGRRLQQSRAQLFGDEQVITLPTAGLPAGIYLVRLRSEKTSVVEKVLVK